MKEEMIKFRCLRCKTEEDFEKELVDMCDETDFGDISVPPRFSCLKCSGIMEPIYYVSTHNITYKIKD